MKAVADPIRAISHIQKTAPGPPVAIASATPARFPVPTREAVLMQKAPNEDTPPWPFLDLLAPSPNKRTISPTILNWTNFVLNVKYKPAAIKITIST